MLGLQPMITKKDKFPLALPNHEMDYARKCATAAEMSYTDFFAALVSGKCLEFCNEIRKMKGFPKTDKDKVLRIKLPAKRSPNKKKD